MSKCDTAGCTGHLGKFSSCLDEAVWQWSMDGADETTGTVDYEGHLALVIVTEPAFVQIDDSDVWVMVDEGHYLVLNDDLGFVYVTRHTAEQAREIFDEFDSRYGEWAEANDC